MIRKEVNAIVIGAEMALAGSANPSKLEISRIVPVEMPSRPIFNNTCVIFLEWIRKSKLY